MAKKVRKHYQKPEIKQVKLVIDEAVLSGCKKFSGDTAGKAAAAKFCGNAACKTEYAS